MPNRIVREGILASERINALSPNAELFYRRLMSVVDDFGRYTANPTLLRAACYPLKLDSVKEDSIKKHLAECVDAGLIVLYTVAAKVFLELQDFRQQVRSKESKYPAKDGQTPGVCAADATHMLSTRAAYAHLDGDVDGDVDVDDKKTSSAGADSIPYDAIVAAYHARLPGLPHVAKLSDKRRRMVRARWAEDAEHGSVDYWAEYFDYVAQSDFLTGRDGRWTGCDFEWLMNASNHLKVIEGKYHRTAQEAQ